MNGHVHRTLPTGLVRPIRPIGAIAQRKPGRRKPRGYILFETVVAMVLLTAGSFAVHRTVQQALITRGQARDYTQARFLLEQRISEIELQPFIAEGTRSGRFSGAYERFSWTYRVRKVHIPAPAPPLYPPPDWQPPEKPFRYPIAYLVNVSVTVSWTRAGKPYSETVETLFAPGRLWTPPEQEKL